MAKMILARGDLTNENPRVYEATAIPGDTFREFRSDKAWTCISFGVRILVVAIPGTMRDKVSAESEWRIVREMIAKSPSLFNAMKRDPKYRYVPE